MFNPSFNSFLCKFATVKLNVETIILEYAENVIFTNGIGSTSK